MFSSFSVLASRGIQQFRPIIRTATVSVTHNISSSAVKEENMKGVVLGVYSGEGADANNVTLSKCFTSAENIQKSPGFETQFNLVKSKLKKGKARVLYGLNETYPAVAVTGLGPENLGYNELEERDDKREAVRNAVAAALSALREVGCTEVDVDPCGDPEAAAEGAFLSSFVFDAHKADKKTPLKINVLPGTGEECAKLWQQGSIKAEGQNIARYLTEMPANHMTPTIFAKEADKHLTPLGVEVIAHDRAWAEEKKMGSFLSVANGSDEPCVFLEMTYNGGKAGEQPVALVGKGITFDSGGISLKVPSSMMNDMRADMGGGAVVVGTIFTLASLKVPINVKGFVPLTENMPNGRATKVGDVVFAMNGKSIQVMNTDAEGRLILADGLCYADTFNPKFVLDIATLTGAMMIALGSSACGVMTNSTADWEAIQKSGETTGDRMWRMPLWDHFKKSMADARLADVCNVSSYGRSGGSCTAAAFLSNFTKSNRWMHLDMAGVMSHDSKDETPYVQKGMTGRPTRTLATFLQNMATGR